MTKVATLRWCGIAGIVGATLLLAADWLLLATFTSGGDFKERWLAVLLEIPRWRLVAGGLMGPIGAWFYVIGFWQLYLALKPAGRHLAFLVFAGFSISFIWAAGAFHASFPLFADAWRAKQAANPAVDLTADPTFHYFGWLFLAAMPFAALATALLAFAILWKETRYPRWFAAVNPALLYLVTLVFAWVPAPAGGLLVIGAGNMVFLAFFVSSTAILWNGGPRGRAEVTPRGDSYQPPIS